MTPDELGEVVRTLKLRERVKFEQGIMVGMAIGVVSCVIIVGLYWVTK